MLIIYYWTKKWPAPVWIIDYYYKKVPNQKSGRKQKEKIPNQRLRESKKKERKENSRSRIERKQKKYAERSFGPDNIWTNTELLPSKQKKKGNHDLKWSSSFDCQPKSCASLTCSPHTKQKQKRKRPKTLKAKVPTKEWEKVKKKEVLDQRN